MIINIAVDTDPIVKAIGTWFGDVEEFRAMVAELARCDDEIRRMFPDIISMTEVDFENWLSDYPEKATELRVLLDTIDELRKEVETVLSGTRIREDLMNVVMTELLGEACGIPNMARVPVEESLVEANLRAAMEALNA